MTIRHFRFRRFQVTILCLTVVVALGFFHAPLLTFAANWLDVGVTPEKSDYVMVLPGGADNRPFVAVAMIHAGLANEILTAQTETDPANDEGLVPTTDVMIRRILTRRGIRDEQIHILPGKSSSTWTDALALRTFMQTHPHSTVAIVTDGYHTRRSRWVFHRVLGPEATRIFFISAVTDDVSPDRWWKSEAGLTIYLSEFCKFAIYILTDKMVILFLAAIAIPLAVCAVIIVGKRKSAEHLRG